MAATTGFVIPTEGFPTILKDPEAVLDYRCNWLPWLKPGDTLKPMPDGATFLVPTGLTRDSQLNDDTSATVWLSGGRLGTNYTVVCRIQTVGGRTEDRSFIVQVRPR